MNVPQVKCMNITIGIFSCRRPKKNAKSISVNKISKSAISKKNFYNYLNVVLQRIHSGIHEKA